MKIVIICIAALALFGFLLLAPSKVGNCHDDGWCGSNSNNNPTNNWSTP